MPVIFEEVEVALPPAPLQMKRGDIKAVNQ